MHATSSGFVAILIFSRTSSKPDKDDASQEINKAIKGITVKLNKYITIYIDSLRT